MKPLASARPREAQTTTITINLPDACAERVGSAAHAVHQPFQEVPTRINIPEGSLSALHKDPGSSPHEMRIAAAVQGMREGR